MKPTDPIAQFKLDYYQAAERARLAALDQDVAVLKKIIPAELHPYWRVEPTNRLGIVKVIFPGHNPIEADIHDATFTTHELAGWWKDFVEVLVAAEKKPAFWKRLLYSTGVL